MIDNIVLYIENVEVDAYDSFKRKLSDAEMSGLLPKVADFIGKGYSDYHYRLQVGSGGGAISIGYKHNSAYEHANAYRMRVEFNPAKSNELHKEFWKVFSNHFVSYRKLIKQLDIAFDLVGVTIDKIIALSLTGRQRSLYKGTVYFGSRGNSGRLKIYDKKKEYEEKQKKKIEDEMTRIEYTVRFEEPMTLQILSSCSTSINSEYEIAYFSAEKLSGDVKAAVLAIHHGYMQMNEFTRTMIKKVKEAVAGMEKLDLDHAYKTSLAKNVGVLSGYISGIGYGVAKDSVSK